MKNRLCSREVINGRGMVKEGSKEVNMVDVLSAQE
jgi:hypothetical protein